MPKYSFAEYLKDEGFIIGWKSIAAYLGVSRNTAITKWKEWGLPIFFLGAHKHRKTPVTHIAFIETWKKQKLIETIQSPK